MNNDQDDPTQAATTAKPKRRLSKKAIRVLPFRHDRYLEPSSVMIDDDGNEVYPDPKLSLAYCTWPEP